MKNKIYNNLIELMMLPGLSGYENRVCNHISNKLKELGLFPKRRNGKFMGKFPRGRT